jgi:hypothetical protein
MFFLSIISSSPITGFFFQTYFRITLYTIKGKESVQILVTESLTKEMNRELLEKEFPDQKKALLVMISHFIFSFFFCTVLLFSSAL